MACSERTGIARSFREGIPMNREEEREFEQQQLLQEIIDDLHSATRDDDTYVDSFVELAVDLIHVAFVRANVAHPVHELFEKQVLPKIQRFTTDLVEQKYLEGLLLQKLVSGSLTARTTGEYTRERLMKRT
jgi:hypothetical protein